MRTRLLCFCIFVPALMGAAQEPPHAGHERLGTVHFASSCNQQAQSELDHAVALLHSFEFGNAIASFRAVLSSDASCGVAYWGIALSDWSNPFASGLKDTRQLQAGRAAVESGEKTGAKTARERDYLAAVAALYAQNVSQRERLIAYRDRMAALAAKYPSDHEAQIFYALAIAASEDPADKTYAGRLKAGAMLEKLFEQEPDHPGIAHYIIHTYDVPALAPQALKAAQRYAAIAPDAPHALHMPSHIFTRLGDWQDSITSNVAAAAAARRQGETAEELHASDYLMYAYLQTAQDEAARRVLDALPQTASRFDPKKLIGGAASPSAAYFALAAIPARHALERGDWKQAARLQPSESPFPYTQAITWFARGLGLARLGESEPADEAADQLKNIHAQLLKSGENYWALQVRIEETEVRAWAALAKGRKDEALDTMASAVTLEDGTEKSAVTPGPLAPAHELYGDMLLQTGQPALALAQFELSLKKEPGRFRSLYGAGHSAQLAGRSDLQQRYFRALLASCEHGDPPGRVELAEAKSVMVTLTSHP